MNTQPYISIVVTARNDNHGGNLLHRIQIFVNGILAQSEKYQLKAELIIVEWNPLPDKPGLAQALSWPVQHNFCTVRIIEVPSEIHGRYRHAERLPLYQMIGKNVGIRRSHGHFVLATNIDILFSNELFAFLASNKMMKGKSYRVNRYDVSSDIPLEASIDEQLTFCNENVIRIYDRYGIHNLKIDNYIETYPHDVDVNPDFVNSVGITPLYTNASGDFQLMAREHWHSLLGYPEFDMYSFHLDSVLCYMAHHSGAVEEILREPMRIYHIEHTSGFIPEEADKLENRLKHDNIRRLTDEELRMLATKMSKDKRPIIFNDDNWGLAADQLNEKIILQARWDNQSRTNKVSSEEKEQTSGLNIHTLEHPVVSIIITTRQDGLHYIKNCVESVLLQNYPNIECIVQDSGSAKETVELLERYGNRIKWVLAPSSDGGEKLSEAIRKCTGDIIGICNCSDELLLNAVQWTVQHFSRHPGIGAIYGEYYVIDDQGRILKKAMPGPISYNYERVLCVEDTIPMQSAFFRRSALDQADLFKNTWLPARCKDFAIWVRLGIRTQISYIPGIISKHRQYVGSDVSKPDTWHDIYNTKKEVLERFFKETAVPQHLKSLRYRALGGLALYIAGVFLEDFSDPFTAMKYICLARNEQPDTDHLNYMGKRIQLWTSWLLKFYQQGDNLFYEKRYEEALTIFDSLTVLDYWISGIQYSKAMCLFQLDRINDALFALEKELTLRPNHEDALKLLQRICVKLK